MRKASRAYLARGLPHLCQCPHFIVLGHLQQLKTATMEAISNMEGHTLLYIPLDDTSHALSALKDKVHMLCRSPWQDLLAQCV